MGFFKNWRKQPWYTDKSFTTTGTFTNLSTDFPNLFVSGTPHMDFIKLYESLSDVFAITNWVTDQIANIPTKIVDKNGKDTTNPDLEELQRQPNPYQNWPEVMKLAYTNYELLGNMFIYRIIPEGFKQPAELHVLPSSAVTILYEGKKNLPSWLNTIIGYEVTIGNVKYTLPASEVLHKKYPALRYENGLWAYGVSKYFSGRMVTRDLKAIYEARTSITEDRGALGIITNKSQNPNPATAQDVQDKLSERYGLGHGQRKFVVTSEDMSFTQIGLGIAELQLIENANHDFNKLCQLNGFDPVIFSTEGSTFANKEIAEKAFIRTVQVPRINDGYLDFNEWNSPFFNGDKIVPDWEKVPELKVDKSAQSKQFNDEIKHGVITPNFAHQKLYGKSDNMPADEYLHLRNLKDGSETNTTGN